MAWSARQHHRRPADQRRQSWLLACVHHPVAGGRIVERMAADMYVTAIGAGSGPLAVDVANRTEPAAVAGVRMGRS